MISIKKEKKLREKYKHVIAVDFAGITSLAGPLIISVLEIKKRIPNIKPFRKISLEESYKLFKKIWNESDNITIGEVSPKEIEVNGIRNSIQIGIERTMKYFIETKSFKTDECIFLIDFFKYEEDNLNTLSILDGDKKIYSIACASIIANVLYRRYMKRIHAEYPIFNWDKNFGYKDEKHITTLKNRGASLFHRNVDKYIENY